MKSRTIFIIFIIGLFTQLIHTQQFTELFKNRIVKASELQNSHIKVDGHLDESAWQNASRQGHFIQREPDDGAEPVNDTFFSVLYDKEYLFFGVWAMDKEPENIDAILTRRDDRSPSDWVYVSIDSYNDNRTAFEFGLNAAGVKQDLRRYDDNNRDYDWDGVWEGEVSITPEGWTAEFQIPFRELRFNSSETMEWGLLVYRKYPRNNDELSVWNYWSNDDAGFVSNYGTLTGLNNIKSENPLYVIPYIVGEDHVNKDLATSIHPENYDMSSNMGADIHYTLENGLTLNATVNPDFGQVEADPADFNLTEFETYFSEKRPFFMEGGNILKFNLGFGDGDNGNNTLFYSRRIGRTPHDWIGTGGEVISVDNPDYVDILSAVKLTGKTESGISIGVMDAVTNREKAVQHLEDGSTIHTTVEPMTNFYVSRLQQDYRDGQTVLGGMLTATNRKLDGTGMDYLHTSAYTGGLDLTHEFMDRNYFIQSALSFSRVAGSEEAIYQTQISSARYFQRPDADHLTLDENATSLSGYSTKFIGGKFRGHFQGAVGVLATSPGFEVNDLGFNRTADYMMQFIWLAYRQWNPGKFFQNYRINFNQWSNGNFAPEMTGMGGNVNFNATLLNNSGFGGGINANASGLSTSQLRGGPAIYLPASLSVWGSYWTDWRKPLSLDFSANIFKNTDNVITYSLSPEFNWRVMNNLQLSMDIRFNNSVDTWSWRGKAWDENDEIHYIFSELKQKLMSVTTRTNYTITTNLSVQFYGQYYAQAGKYSGFREADQLRDSDFDRRLKNLKYASVEYGDDTRLLLNNFTGIEYVLYDGIYEDFNYQQFRSNLVLRWEFKTGSALYLVWSDGYTNYVEGLSGTNDAGFFNVTNDINDLLNTTGDNVLLLKVSYLLHI